MPSAGRAPGRAGGQQLPAQRQLPGQPPAVVRPPGLPGQQGRHAPDFSGGRGDCAGHPPGPLRHAAAVRDGLLAQGRQAGADRRRRQDAGPGEEGGRGHLRRRQGRGRGAAEPPGQPHPGLRRHACRARRQDRRGESGLGEGTLRVDAREGRLQPGHDRGGQGREDAHGRPVAAPAPGAARAGKGHARARLWVGFACSLQEIVKESAIYQRERLVNLGLLPYLFSKILVLAALAFLQTIVIICVIFWRFTDQQPELMTWLIGFFITTFLTIFAAINLGLLISAGVNNITQANSALPLILIPQIIFAGVLFNLEGLGKYLSWLMISRWSIAAYGVLVEVEDMIAEAQEQNTFNFPLPFEDANQVYQLSINNLLLNWGVLILHSLIYFLLTYWLQKRKDIL